MYGFMMIRVTLVLACVRVLLWALMRAWGYTLTNGERLQVKFDTYDFNGHKAILVIGCVYALTSVLIPLAALAAVCLWGVGI